MWKILHYTTANKSSCLPSLLQEYTVAHNLNYTIPRLDEIVNLRIGASATGGVFEAQYAFAHSSDILDLEEDIIARHNFTVYNITIPNSDACFGSGFNRALFSSVVSVCFYDFFTFFLL